MSRLIYLTILSCILPFNSVHANCDTSTFRWECDVPVKVSAQHGASSLVHCGGSIGYVTRHEYDQIARNKRASINMVLKINDEYIDSPCVLDER